MFLGWPLGPEEHENICCMICLQISADFSINWKILEKDFFLTIHLPDKGVILQPVFFAQIRAFSRLFLNATFPPNPKP